jgi:hypothetical protein
MFRIFLIFSEKTAGPPAMQHAGEERKDKKKRLHLREAV